MYEHEDDCPEEGTAIERIANWFEVHNDKFLKFEQLENKKVETADLCAFLYLYEKLGPPSDGDAVACAEHDQFWFGWGEEQLEKLTEEDVIYLTSCGVMFDTDVDSLWMFA